MKKILLSLLLILLFAGCANVSPHVDYITTSDPVGFWSGLWHGLVLPISFFGSIFSNDIAIYAIDNSGGWYDFGFVLGAGGLGFNLGFFNNSK